MQSFQRPSALRSFSESDLPRLLAFTSLSGDTHKVEIMKDAQVSTTNAGGLRYSWDGGNACPLYLHLAIRNSVVRRLSEIDVTTVDVEEEDRAFRAAIPLISEVINGLLPEVSEKDKALLCGWEALLSSAQEPPSDDEIAKQGISVYCGSSQPLSEDSGAIVSDTVGGDTAISISADAEPAATVANGKAE